jgi:HEAT repeat protein
MSRPMLEGLLGHRSEAVRYRAVHALDRIGAEPSAAALRAAAASEQSIHVRALIAEVLRADH